MSGKVSLQKWGKCTLCISGQQELKAAETCTHTHSCMQAVCSSLIEMHGQLSNKSSPGKMCCIVSIFLGTYSMPLLNVIFCFEGGWD